MNPLTALGCQSFESLRPLNDTYFTPNRNKRYNTQSPASIYTSLGSAHLFTQNPDKNGQYSDRHSTLTTRKQREKIPPIGGPGQPEMSSFKSVNANNLVNLFTGDFNYNIPLMDVGGYPLNIYYNGGITMEQEASWVGLGWNINPGNINRNVRGVPDDFNGQDTLKQVQIMKPNKTWGLGLGANAELFGIKAPISANLGAAFNNYLGPSLDLALRGNAALKIGSIAGSEKSPASAGVNIGIDVNSRSGASFSGSVSLTANAALQNNSASFGAGLSTSYNSRAGIKALEISEQAQFNTSITKNAVANYYLNGPLNNLSKFSTCISFVKPSYIPSLRMPLTNTAWSGHFQVGLGAFGIATDLETEVYGQKSEIATEDILQRKPMVGYLYYQNAINHPDYVMDFTRFNDREVTPNTPVISVPQYTYDVFSIQSEGTGGTIRAFRNDLGYVRDNITTSKDKNFSLGADVDLLGHYGGNFNTVKTPSTIGEWNSGNKLRNAIQFRSADSTFENVYFRNPGENCVLDSNRFKQVGGTDLVRFVLGGSNNSPTVEAKLQSYNSLMKPNATPIDLGTMPVINQRNKRTQVISFLTADEASHAGLDVFIKSYDNQTFLDNIKDTLIYQAVPRVGSYRKPHHISQINVTENNGKRYVYGIPVYNTLQQDFTFSIYNPYSPYSAFALPDTMRVSDLNQIYQSSPLLSDKSGRDGYVQITTTPPYAYSFLLSGILSPDYIDVTGNGITEDDLGEAVKFNYTRIQFGNDTVHRWRTPLSADTSANFNGGSRSEVKDDKGIICYGERESWYLSSVESKTMIALFYTSSRPNDGKGAKSVYGGIDTSDLLPRELDSIALYNKADLKSNGLAKAKPIKTAHFGYGNELCQGTPDGISGKGKLTLDSIWFTYNRTTRSFKNRYRFSYGNNQPYVFGASDRWGNYKPASMNPPKSGLKNSDYPYSIQDPAKKDTIDLNAGAWMLNKIVLPAGGEINVSYETDDYAWIQNKRAAEMMNIVGFGNTSSYSEATDRLYSFGNLSSIENDYVFIQVPVACSDTVEVHNRYLQGMTQLAFKIWVLMPKGPEYIMCYASYNSCGVVSTNHNIIWIKMNRLAGKSPLSVTTLEYLRQQLPGQAFKGYDVSEEQGFKQVGDMLLGMLTSLRDAFSDPINAFRKDGKAMHTDLTKCFVRLNDPDGFKYGGGYRVKSVILKDNWDSMTAQYAASYGQKYDYTTTENFYGTIRRISSGVASYEPSIGDEENPFQSIIQVEDYLPAGPTSFGAVEMPVLDAFFPAPLVGYSKVTVTPIKFDTTKKSRSGIGKQVTEFYTAKDFPVYYSYTPFDAESIKEFHQASTQAFFNKYAYDFKAQSQGFLVATNDMHGKIKSQSSYAENDTATRISYTENFYKNTGANGLNDKFSFISKDNSGHVYNGNMGIDIDLMTDTREFSVKSTSLEMQGQVDALFILLSVATIWPVSGIAQNIYRAVTTSKVINYHAVLDSVVVIDKGSQISTKNVAYDGETGEVLLTRTNNEFNNPVYNTSYPAYWAYGGMGLAYKNIDAVYSNITFSDGKLTTPEFDFSVFESGDELLIKKAVRNNGCNGQVNDGGTELVWAFDKNKNATSLITTSDFIFIDRLGRPYTMDSVTFRIIRSGHRNLLDAKMESVTSMVNPISTGKLRFDTASKVINASATEFKEKWLVDNDVFNRFRLVTDPVACTSEEIPDSLGYLEKNINPYRKGLIGNFRLYRSMVFYETRKEYDTTFSTNLSVNGYLNNFRPYWDFNTSGNLVPDSASLQWVWNKKLNKTNSKGMELETVDALGIYTSAQYGYNKSMPVAIANNARNSEMFAEGFEDYGYGESINNTSFNFFNRQINFNSLPNSSIINTDTANFRAHTGRYALKVNGSSTSPLSLPITAEPDSTYTPGFVYRKDTTGALITPGGNYSFEPRVPKYVPNSSNQGTASFSTTRPSVNFNINPLDTFLTNGNRMHYYSQSSTFYISVTTAQNYSFGVSMGTAYNNSGADVDIHSNGLSASIYDLSGSIVSSYSISQNGFESTSGSYSAYLCPGVYLVSVGTTELYSATNNGMNYTTNNYSWSCTNSTSPDYKNLTKSSDCIYTHPIAASANMENPLFLIPMNKKMLFTAWIHENCGDPVNGITCRDSTYTYNQVQLNFEMAGNYNSTLYPSGPIIDGWQKYEGSFIAPFPSTSMTLSLVNTGLYPIYFDDIRIQPFNSNLKSYVYDPVNLRLTAELDANNYATFYDYDEEGTLIRTKVETREGIKTVTETRSSLQKVIN